MSIQLKTKKKKKRNKAKQVTYFPRKLGGLKAQFNAECYTLLKPGSKKIKTRHHKEDNWNQ